MKPSRAAVVTALLLLAVAGATPAAAASKISAAAPEDPTAESVTALIEHAEHTRIAAAERSAEWLRTAELISQARQVLAAGNLDEAAQLATEALRQGELAIEQAERESEAWRKRVPR